jgi:hypothetical protein
LLTLAENTDYVSILNDHKNSDGSKDAPAPPRDDAAIFRELDVIFEPDRVPHDHTVERLHQHRAETLQKLPRTKLSACNVAMLAPPFMETLTDAELEEARTFFKFVFSALLY